MRRRGLFGRASQPESSDDVRGMAPDALELLDHLPGEWVIVSHAGRVYRESANFASLGLLNGSQASSSEFLAMASETLTDGIGRTADLAIGGVDVGAPPGTVRVRTSKLDDDYVLLLVDDISAATRVDTMRRDFIANVSHELKTPVGALVLLADAVQSANDDPKALRKFTTRMQIEAARLSALITDLTDLSRLQAANAMDAARMVSVKSIVAEAVDAVHLAAQDKRIDIVRDLPHRIKVFADEEQATAALRNLLTNAIRYSPPHTKVTVIAREVDGYTEIAVEDQGIGIEPSQQARIFERFHRVDPARSRQTGGTGLGLAIVKHICLAHGGEVTVQSEVGRGSTFTLRFPLPRAGAPTGREGS